MFYPSTTAAFDDWERGNLRAHPVVNLGHEITFVVLFVAFRLFVDDTNTPGQSSAQAYHAILTTNKRYDWTVWWWAIC